MRFPLSPPPTGVQQGLFSVDPCGRLENLRQFVGKPLPQELMILLDLPGCSGRLLELRERQGDLDQQPPEAKIGIFEEKVKFAENACALIHPSDTRSSADDVLLFFLFFSLLTLGRSQVKQRRRAAFAHYSKRASDLQKEEDRCQSAIPQEKCRLIEGKRFLLLQEMARDSRYNDDGLAKLGLSGTKLTGPGDPVPAQPQQPLNSAIDKKLYCRLRNSLAQ